MAKKSHGFPPTERALVRNRKIGFVFQNFNLLPRTSALDNVIMPLTYTAEDLSDREGASRATELLSGWAWATAMHHEPSQLSGGQQQRVAIARRCQPAAAAVRRRAYRQPGLTHQRGGPAHVPAAQPRGRHHRHPGDA